MHCFDGLQPWDLVWHLHLLFSSYSAIQKRFFCVLSRSSLYSAPYVIIYFFVLIKPGKKIKTTFTVCMCTSLYCKSILINYLLDYFFSESHGMTFFFINVLYPPTQNFSSFWYQVNRDDTLLHTSLQMLLCSESLPIDRLCSQQS